MIFNYPCDRIIKLREFLLEFHISKSKIYTLFLDKLVLVNNEITNENTMLKPGDIVSIIQDEDIDYKPNYNKINIIYEDDYLLIIDKPSGIVIHNDSKNKTDSLCNIVAGYYNEKGYNINVRFAHRLDCETTGLIIFCKDILTHAYMNHFISTHDIKREYRCLVEGIVSKKEGTIHLAIGEDRHISNKKRVSKTGKEAITHYKLIKSYNGYSLLSILLETGRTHQIRVHMSYIGHPLLGDTLYGGNLNLIKRVALHSSSVEFIHPVTKKILNIECMIHDDMNKLIK